MSTRVVSVRDQQCVVAVPGNLTALIAPDLQRPLREAIAGGVTEVVFDFTASDAIDSSGLGLMIACSNALTPKAGKVRVVNASPDIVALLNSMRLTSRFEVLARAGDARHA